MSTEVKTEETKVQPIHTPTTATTVVLHNQPQPTTPPVTPTKQVKTPEEEAKEQSDEYMKELRLIASQRVKLPDGSLSNPGAGIPQSDLAKIYNREKLDKKI